MAIDQVLVELRSLRIRQSDLARWLHVARQTVSHWYHEKKPIPFHHRRDLLRLAATARALDEEGKEPQEALSQIEPTSSSPGVQTSKPILPKHLETFLEEARHRMDRTAYLKLRYVVFCREMLDLIQESAAADPATLRLTVAHLDRVGLTALGLFFASGLLLDQYLELPDRKADFSGGTSP